jgi:plasmid maintenance system antidote protein VapI
MRESLERLGIGQTELAGWFGVGDRTIRHYIKGDRNVPPSLALLLEYLIEHPAALEWFRDRELARLRFEKRELARLMGMGD